MNPNLLFDRTKLVVTSLEPLASLDIDTITSRVEELVKHVGMRMKEDPSENDKKLPYDKELIILPRQKTYVQETNKQSKFPKKEKNRMIWDEDKKGWILRRNKKKEKLIAPIIEATKNDAYEVRYYSIPQYLLNQDVFRKMELQQELVRSKKKLRKMKK